MPFRFFVFFCFSNTSLTICIFLSRSGLEYDFVITTIIGTEGYIDVAFERLFIASGNNLLEVPSTQNHITFISEFSFPSLMAFFDHFFTAFIAPILLKNEGSKPTVSIIRKSNTSFSYTFSSFVVPLSPKSVSAISSPKTALIKVDLPTPESPITSILPLSILFSIYYFLFYSATTYSLIPL